MRDPGRPLPHLDELDTGEFWAATKDHKLNYQTCNACGTVVFYPRSHCTHCGALDLQWNTSNGEGTIYSYSVVRKSRAPYFRDHFPYVVALVDLDEGFRMLTNVVGAADPVNDIRIGQRVKVDWEDYDDLAIPQFRLA